MTHRLVIAGQREYDFAPDAPPRIGLRWFALAVAQIVDEIEAEPIRVTFEVRVETAGIAVKHGSDGSFALIAQPWVRFPPAPGPRPGVRVHLAARGFLPRTADFAIPFDVRSVAAPAPVGATVVTLSSSAGLATNQMLVLGIGLDQEFARIELIGPGANQVTLAEPLRFAHALNDSVVPATGPATQIVMHREPVAFRGRVVRINAAGGPGTPVPNATITLADFWRTQFDVRNRPVVGNVPIGEMTGPAPNTFPLGLAQGAIAHRLAGATAGAVNLPVAAGDEKRTLSLAAAQQNTILLSDLNNLNPGTVLRIESGDAVRSELHTIAGLTGLGGIADPALATLDFSLLAAHAPDIRVDRLLPPVVPLPLNLVDALAVGDRSVFVDALPAGPIAGLQVASAGVADEFHDCSLYSATSDTDGYFRLPALHRMAQVRLDVDDAGAITSFFIDPEYGNGEQWLDLAIP